MAALVTAEIVVGACLFAALATLTHIFVRRRLLARSGDLMLCALRIGSGERWRAGLLPVSYTHLDVYKRQSPPSGNTPAPTFGPPAERR